MRIGLVTGEYPPMQGGIGAHCRVLAQTLSDQGHTVYIFSDAQAAESDPRLHLTHAPARWRGATLRALNAWATEHRLDVVNLHYQTAAYQMSPWIHFITRYVKAAPVVTTFHDLRFPYLFPKAGPLRPWIVRRLARTSAGVIATNHEDAARLTFHRQHALIPIGSSVRVDLPPDFDRSAWRARLSIPADAFVVAHFGFINHSKGVDTLIDALALLQRTPRPIHLLMIGGRTGSSDPTNAAYAQTIDARITSAGLDARVHWTGFVDDRAASGHFAASDVVALPFRDGASYRRSSLMAAIQHGCAIITTRTAVDIPTFISGQNLLLIAPGNAPALAAALQVAAKSPELISTLRDGAHTLRQEFAWDHIARANVAFFEKVCHDRPTR